MNILVISAVFPPEPVVSAKLSADLVLELSTNHNVTVLCPKPTRPYGFKFPEHEEITDRYNKIVLESYTCPKSSLFGRIKESYSFGKVCYSYIESHRNDFDCIYMNTWPIFGQYFVKKAASKYNIPYIIHVQDVYPESLSNKLPLLGSLISAAFRPLDASVLDKANKVIAISEKMKNYLHQTRNIPLSKISVVYNWQDETSFLSINSDLDKSTYPFTFMYLGNIGPVAGCDLLIRAFSQANLKSSRLIIAGAGSKRDSLIFLAKELKADNIEFLNVPDGQVAEIQSKADVLLLPIKKGAAASSIPSKLPAYLFSGKPIISTVDNDSDTAHSINVSGCGWVLEAEDLDRLILLMKEVSKMPQSVLLDKGMKGREYALKHFSKGQNLKRLVIYIEEAIMKE